jgi:hypothetical protein
MFDDHESGRPHQKHALVIWNLREISAFFWRKTKKTSLSLKPEINLIIFGSAVSGTHRAYCSCSIRDQSLNATYLRKRSVYVLRIIGSM